MERTDARVAGVRDGRPLLDDGRIVDVANVVWCTGFGKDVSWIELPVTGEDGWPEQERGVVPAHPGLYFLGLPFLHAFASMLVGGVGRDAERVAEHIAERHHAGELRPDKGRDYSHRGVATVPDPMQDGVDHVADPANWAEYAPDGCGSSLSSVARAGRLRGLALRMLGPEAELRPKLTRFEPYRLAGYTSEQRGLPAAKLDRRFRERAASR